jgi:hypothetical protein
MALKFHVIAGFDAEGKFLKVLHASSDMAEAQTAYKAAREKAEFPQVGFVRNAVFSQRCKCEVKKKRRGRPPGSANADKAEGEGAEVEGDKTETKAEGDPKPETKPAVTTSQADASAVATLIGG